MMQYLEDKLLQKKAPSLVFVCLPRDPQKSLGQHTDFESILHVKMISPQTKVIVLMEKGRLLSCMHPTDPHMIQIYRSFEMGADELLLDTTDLDKLNRVLANVK